MFQVFMHYEVNPTTWFYLSLLMVTGIFFKFRRIWSVRNLDLLLVLSLGPGLLLAAHGFHAGYVILLTFLILLLIRMLCDPMMNRRPLLEVNLSKSGLIFCCAALMVFQLAALVLTQTREGGPQNVNASLEQLLMFHLNERLLKEEADGSTVSEETLGFVGELDPQDQKDRPDRQDRSDRQKTAKTVLRHGPGMPFFTQLADCPRQWRFKHMKERELQNGAARAEEAEQDLLLVQNPLLTDPSGVPAELVREEWLQIRWTIFLAALAQIAIVTGIVLTGWAHFENFNTGIAAATLYLLLPYVAQMPSRIDHLVPAALIVWAIFSWRLPSLAGVLLGTAAALSYYPIFLLPLWCSFYWSRGLYRFLCTSLGVFLLFIVIAIPLCGGLGAFLAQSGDIFGCVGLFSRNAAGFWDIPGDSIYYYRIPVIVMYLALVFFLMFWPAQKNFGTLMSSSAVLMIGAQFCHPFQGGTYMAWFLPLVILVILRPNLEDRTAVRAVERHRRHANTSGKNA